MCKKENTYISGTGWRRTFGGIFKCSKLIHRYFHIKGNDFYNIINITAHMYTQCVSLYNCMFIKTLDNWFYCAKHRIFIN